MDEAPSIESKTDNKSIEIPLNLECLSVIKDSNSENYKLKIKLNVTGKEEHFFIDLEQNRDIKTELEEAKKQILELREIIKFKDEKIKLLEEKLNKYTKIEKENEKFLETNNIKDDKLYDDFNIKLNEPIHILNTHTNEVICLILIQI